ncbi:hypothetical protein JOS77_27015 [Chromobacterium haemolyticum]|uniref:hypothetical protein n=1 Tax=Chromobacterium haemolyticum TaxID=394935 RepID=UPI000DEFDF00|nr:hypothetical protein [Chromobacterium haemolyticum]UGA37580.1 hypothetical protein JOS77_27015 [Chromobacterium haemolyticum]
MPQRLKQFLLARLQEPSTWRGAVMLATALGITVSPDTENAIIAIGLAVSGLLGALLPEGRGNAE